MKLSSISIKNFKSINENGITIPIAPITLLFGPNNAGKSTIIQALHLVREVFSPFPDFDKIKSYDTSINIGKFINYVHNHDINRAISIKLEFNEVSFPSVEPLFGEETSIDINKIFDEIHSLAIEFSIAWDFTLNKPLLKQYTIFINEKELTNVQIEYSSDGMSCTGIASPFSIEALLNNEDFEELKNFVKNYTKDDLPEKYKHYNVDEGFWASYQQARKIAANPEKFTKEYQDDLLDMFFPEATGEEREKILTELKSIVSVKEQDVNSEKVYDKIKDKFTSIIADTFTLKHIKRFNQLRKVTALNPLYLNYLMNKIRIKLPETMRIFCDIISFIKTYNSDIASILPPDLTANKPIMYKIENSTTSHWSKPFVFKLATNEESTNSYEDSLLNCFFYRFGSGIRNKLNKLLYIGPVREQIARGLVTPQKLSDEKWAQGSAIWDLIATSNTQKLDLLNSRIKKLGLDYQLVLKKLYTLDDKSILKEKLESLLANTAMLTNEDAPLVRDFLEQQVEIMIKLENTKTKVQTEIKDMGLGISQVMPILGASVFAKKDAFIVIEEPESHIHPKMQVNLGDIIIETALQSKNSPLFLIETHSEHLLLRFLRRIRENSEENLSTDFPKITKENISVNYIYPNEEGETLIKHLPVTDEGEFTTRWPHGFFDERAKELF